MNDIDVKVAHVNERLEAEVENALRRIGLDASVRQGSSLYETMRILASESYRLGVRETISAVKRWYEDQTTKDDEP